MKAKRHGRVVAAITILLIAAAFAAVSQSRADGPQQEVISPELGAGAPTVPLAATRRAAFERLGFRGLRLIGTVRDQAFYRVNDAKGRACYAIGPAAAIGEPGSITCRRVLSPVIDWTYVEVTRVHPDPRVYLASGIAADGVEIVELVDATGNAVARAEVKNNLYSFDVTSSVNAAALVAFNGMRERVFERPIGRGPRR